MAELRQSDDLDERLARARAAESARVAGPAKPASDKSYAQGSRVLAELIGAPLGGGLIGWALDRWLGTAPWAMLILLVLAVVAAFVNIYRMGQGR